MENQTNVSTNESNVLYLPQDSFNNRIWHIVAVFVDMARVHGLSAAEDMLVNRAPPQLHHQILQEGFKQIFGEVSDGE